MAESQQMEQSLQVVMEHEVVQAQLSEMLDGDLMKSFRENMAPIRALMSRYRCAMMEVETKFKVLNEQFSLEHDRNRIESIKTRLKSMDSILEKLHRRKLPITLSSMEENLNDVAGVRVICSFVDDIYVLVDCLLHQSYRHRTTAQSSCLLTSKQTADIHPSPPAIHVPAAVPERGESGQPGFSHPRMDV